MSKRVKQYLMLFAALGVVAVALGGGSGTFASFNAQVSNNGNYFATGTLLLHQGNNANSNICTSETDTTGNVNVNCGYLIDLQNQKPGSGAVQTAKISLANAGSISPSDLQLKVTCSSTRPKIGTLSSGPGALSDGAAGSLSLTGLTQTLVAGTVINVGSDAYYVTTTTSPVSGAATVPVKAQGATTNQTGDVKLAAFGTTDFCASNNLQFSIQEDTANWAASAACIYGTGTSSCTSGDSFANFPHWSSGSGTEDLTSSLWQGGPSGANPLNAGTTRYFEVTVSMPDTGGNQNADQNAEADFDLAWTIDQ